MFYIVLYGGGPRLKTSTNYDIFQDWLKLIFSQPFIRWGMSSLWPSGPNSESDSKETTAMGETHPSVLDEKYESHKKGVNIHQV